MSEKVEKASRVVVPPNLRDATVYFLGTLKGTLSKPALRLEQENKETKAKQTMLAYIPEDILATLQDAQALANRYMGEKTDD